MESKISTILAYHPLFGLPVMVICFVGAAAAGRTLDHENSASYLVLCWSLSAAFVAIPLAIRFCYRQLVEWSRGLKHFIICDTEDVEKYFVERLRFFRGSSTMYVIATGFGIVASVIVYVSVLREYESKYAICFGIAIVFWSEFLAGASLYCLFFATRAIRKVAMLPGSEVRVEAHQFGVLSTGTVLFKCGLAAIAVWTFYQIPIVPNYLKGGSESWAIAVTPPVVGLTIPTLGVVLGLFIAAQIPLHRRMIDTKRREIRRLESMLAQLRPERAEDISDDLMKKITFVTERLKEAQALPEWPFTKPAAFYTGLSSVLSVIGSAGLSKVFQGIVTAWISTTA